MKKTAALLCFLLALGLIGSWLSMTHSDAQNASANISRGFAEMDSPAFDADMRAADERHSEETQYGIGGAIALIAGFALWPRSPKTAPAPQAA